VPQAIPQAAPPVVSPPLSSVFKIEDVSTSLHAGIVKLEAAANWVAVQGVVSPYQFMR